MQASHAHEGSEEGEKAKEREARRAERHRAKEQERERARLAAAPPVAPPVAASVTRDRTRAREREERQKAPELREAPNPAFLMAKLVNGKDEGDSSDSSARKRRVASQLRRHTADEGPSYVQPVRALLLAPTRH